MDKLNEVNYMPRVNYNDIPYEKKWSTGEQVISHSFYNPDPDYSESEETYRGYCTHDLFGLKIEKLCDMRKDGEMVSSANSDEHQAWYKDEDIYTAIENVPPAQPRIRLYRMQVQEDRNDEKN